MTSCVNMMTEIESASMKNITIIKDEPMSKHTSWRTGGAARRYVQATTMEALASFIATLPEKEEILWLGLGSNTLVRDAGFNGTVIATQGVMTQLELLNETTIYAGAGVASAKIARFCSRKNLSGADFFAGIPGLLGGALAMNAGAFGGETWPLVIEVETMNRKGEIKKRQADEFKYSYRHVDGIDNEWFISATLQLSKHRDDNKTIDIKQLLAKRSATQPTGVASCGSVFRNPKGFYAAQLIEECGLKGQRVGGAIVSEKHANFIINDNKASAADIESLIHLIQKTVADRRGVPLQPEVRIVGESE